MVYVVYFINNTYKSNMYNYNSRWTKLFGFVFQTITNYNFLLLNENKQTVQTNTKAMWFKPICL